jgi:hypothetical protein
MSCLHPFDPKSVLAVSSGFILMLFELTILVDLPRVNYLKFR